MAIEIEQLIILILILILLLLIWKFIFVPFYSDNKKMNHEHELKILKHTPNRINALSNYKEATIKKNDSKIKRIGKNLIKVLVIVKVFLFSP